MSLTYHWHMKHNAENMKPTSIMMCLRLVLVMSVKLRGSIYSILDCTNTILNVKKIGSCNFACLDNCKKCLEAKFRPFWMEDDGDIVRSN